MSGPRNRALATQIGRGRTVRGTEGPHFGRGKFKGEAPPPDRNVWPCIDSWYGTEGWMRVQHQLEHQLPPSEAPADPSICPSLSSRRRHHQVVGLLELCDGHGAGFAFEFVYREQLSQPQVARSCMPMRCCSFSLWNLSKTLGKDQPVRGAQRDERQSL